MTEFERWIVTRGLGGSSVAELVSGFAEHLIASGIPLIRVNLALPTVDPMIRALDFRWARSTGTVAEPVAHEHDTAAFDASPYGWMLQAERFAYHWRMHEAQDEVFDVFDEVRQLGGTDYLARLIRLENESAPGLRGIAFSLSTDRAGGLLPDEIAQIDGLLPLLGLAAFRITLSDIAVAVLDTYLGLSAGRRVLSGEIKRGAGTTMTAALFFADLRGFTAVADRTGVSLIARLDEHLGAMAEPVLAAGGEVLKFLGDGMLAVFPITADQPQNTACRAAVDAAREALVRNAAVNRARPGETPLDLDIALHCGEVFYGNVGAAGRLDFTVIGPAVNEVSRMEALCGQLGCNIILSASVAASTPAARHLGRYPLRGLAAERDLFTVS